MKSSKGGDNQRFFNGAQRLSGERLSPSMLKGFRLFFYFGCLTSIVLVIVVGMVSYEALNRQQVLEKWVEHAYKVLRKTDSINMYFNQTLLPDGYIGAKSQWDNIFFDIHEHQNLARQISELAALVKNNRLPFKEVGLLQQQIDSLSHYANKDIQQFRRQTGKINVTLMHIKLLEESFLASRENAYKRSGKQTQIIIVIGSLLILVIVSFLIYLILTELKNRIRAYQEEHELNQLKSSFITLASHEFRTPLSSVLLSATLIERYLERNEKEPIVKHVTKIKHVVHSLEGVLEDFLSLEKLEEGLMVVELTTFDLGELCQDMMSAFKLTAQPGQQLIYVLPRERQMVKLDRTLMEKSLSSLISNAIKYAGDEASVWLTTEVIAGNVVISIKDNGVGIADEDQKKLSTIFYRVNNTGHIAGAGLGLNIVKRYVQLMNGTFHFSSVPHKETCFTMTFPVNV